MVRGCAAQKRDEFTSFQSIELRLDARRPPPLVEPLTILRHLRALPLWRMPLARRRLVALIGRPPPKLDAIVQVIRHLEADRAVDHVFERERPR